MCAVISSDIESSASQDENDYKLPSEEEGWIETEAILDAPPAAESVPFVFLSQMRENSCLNSSSIITNHHRCRVECSQTKVPMSFF